MTDVEKIKKVLRKKRDTWKPSEFLSSGPTLLNLVCSGRPDGAFPLGSYCFIVGDSTSGKTFISLTCLAEAAIDKRFDKYRFIYDNAEGGALMDIRKFFGQQVADRIEPPAVDDNGEPIYSRTVEEFYYHVDDAIKLGRPFIFIEDSMDSLSSEAESDKFDEHKKAYRAGKEAAGSYGDNKAKMNSANLRKVIGSLRESDSILLVINQTRDSFEGFGKKKTRSGGHALRFYATVEIWCAVKRRIQRQVKGKKRQLGVECEVWAEKNRVTGREGRGGSVLIPIYRSFGIDDVGSCVNYLVDEGCWKKEGGKIVVTGLGPTFKGMMEGVIKQIEERELGDDLRALVGDAWNEIEEACVVKRRKRYE